MVEKWKKREGPCLFLLCYFIQCHFAVVESQVCGYIKYFRELNIPALYRSLPLGILKERVLSRMVICHEKNLWNILTLVQIEPMSVIFSMWKVLVWKTRVYAWQLFITSSHVQKTYTVSMSHGECSSFFLHHFRISFRNSPVSRGITCGYLFLLHML